MAEITPVIKTIKQIQDELNGGGPEVWVPVDGFYGLAKPEVANGEVNFFASKEGIVLQVFLNITTSEIKLFVAKYLDVPNRENLFNSK